MIPSADDAYETTDSLLLSRRTPQQLAHQAVYGHSRPTLIRYGSLSSIYRDNKLYPIAKDSTGYYHYDPITHQPFGAKIYTNDNLTEEMENARIPSQYVLKLGGKFSPVEDVVDPYLLGVNNISILILLCDPSGWPLLRQS